MSSAALAAEQIRRHRAELVEALRAGRTTLPGLVGDRDPLTIQIKIVVLAEAVPGVGKVRSRRVLDTLGIVKGARWGELTEEEATRVVAALAEAAKADGASPATEP